MKFKVIGIADNKEQYFAPEVLDIIRQGKVFSGGLRHHELVRHLLPQEHEWIDVKAPLSQVFEAYRAVFKKGETVSEDARKPISNVPCSIVGSLIVFASGDPLFYGYATTLKREFPDADIQVFPAFNSLQLLAHRLLLPYQDMRCVSVTGRPWKGLDDALIRGERLIGCLTDKYKSPRLIADRLLEYGYDGYTMSIGQCLGNPDGERVATYALADVPDEVAQPNCIILQRTVPRQRFLGIPESRFNLLDGRVNMITKAPVRLLTLSILDLHQRRCLWDVGFCTGSVSIEARLQFPHLDIQAFEIRPEGEELMARNSRLFGAPGINCHIGDFLLAPLDGLPRPDAVFIGGHGGRLREMVDRIRRYLLPGGVIVFNSVSEVSRQMFCEAVDSQGLSIVNQTHIALDQHNPITILSAQ